METMSPIYDRHFQCLNCKHPFTSKKVRTRFVKAVKHDTDFCTFYADPANSPLLYHVIVCPSCGFSMSDDFTPYFAPGTAEIIAQAVTKNWVPHDFSGERTPSDAIKTLKLAAYCASLKKEKHVTIAGLYLRLAWIYRTYYETSLDQHRRFINLALEEYKESYSNGDYAGTQMSETRLMYLIGELYRRIGDFPEAIRMFSKVVQKRSTSSEKGIIDMAQERWQDIRDEQKGEVEIPLTSE